MTNDQRPDLADDRRPTTVLMHKRRPPRDRRSIVQTFESFQLPCTGNAGAPPATSALLNTALATMCAGAAASICSFRKIKLLALNEANSNPCPWVIASVGQASTQYPQKIHRL